MKKKIIIFSTLIGVVVIAVYLTVTYLINRLNESGSIEYPDFPYADDSSDSWLQKDDEIVEIDWYVNYTGFGIDNDTLVMKEILKKTGVKINFVSNISNTSEKLNTMIANDSLPDVITINGSSPERVQLENGNKIFPIQELALRWAPSLNNRLDEEMVDHFKASDDNIYGIPNHFYTTLDLESLEAQGNQLLPNGAILARRDYLDSYIDYKKSIDPNWKDIEATTPSGFIEMSKWVKENYELSDSNPTVLLSPFESNNSNIGNQGINWLMEYFNVKPEDSEGNLVYPMEADGFLDVMTFLNNLYQEKLLISSNLSANSSMVGSYIQQGKPFVVISSPQNYQSYLKNWAKNNEGKEYVSIVLTNENGDVPQLRSVAGYGYRYSMITTNCERPDAVIKLFDFLYSEEGQRLIYYGVEGETYEYKVRPNETVDGITYKYGQIDFTKEVKNAINNSNTIEYGMFGTMILLRNSMYAELTSMTKNLYTFQNYTIYNAKAGLIPYTYDHRAFDVLIDSNHKNYLQLINVESLLRQLWYEYLPKMIAAKDAKQIKEVYDEAMEIAKRYGYKEYLEAQNIAFQKNKANLGIDYAYPVNDINSGYFDLSIDSIYGDKSYWVQIPDSIPRK